MNKEQFLAAVRERLSALPRDDVEQSLDYYGEMIDDRVEDGLSEEQAVEAMGTVEEIVSQILTDTPLPKLVKAKVKPERSLRTWKIVLLVAGSPVWVPLALTAVILFAAMYIVIWSLVICLYAVDLSFAAGGVSGIAGSVIWLCMGNSVQALCLLGAGLVCAGLAVFLFLLSNRAAAGSVKLGKIILLWVKSWFVRKGKSNE